jgi:mRNA interferase MazF
MRYNRVIRRGDVYFAQSFQTAGHVQGKSRPVVVVQNDVGNAHSPTVIVVPITGENKRFKLHVPIYGYKTLYGWIMAEQIMTLDKSRLERYITTLDGATMTRLDKAIRISLSV